MKVLLADQTTTVYQLSAGQTVHVGREHGEVRIEDDGVSSRHVRLTVKTNEILFEDLGSSNGTFHRNINKKMGVILVGDSIRVGSTEIHFDTREPAQPGRA